MKEAMKRGLGFGSTSGIITTLGLIIGLNSGTGLKLAVIGGIITVAIADAFSDALGIHISEETSKRSGRKAVLQAATSTFFAKLIVASTFIIPIAVFPLDKGVIISLVWGFLLLISFNYILSKVKGEKALRTIIYHVVIATIVITITYYVGKIVKFYFG